MAFNFVLLFVTVNGFFIDAKLTEVVQTDKGPVQGRILQTVVQSLEFSCFQGIRYAKPPTGYHRFKAPEETESWTETFQATSEAIPCPQKKFTDTHTIGSEDCLNLNVYTPKTNFSIVNATSLLPVMVWIYGGGFHRGYSSLNEDGPDYFIENGVVVVGMNYRVGVLGFLALNLPNVTGNAGLKDQLLALKWVQRNIRAFGGDPDSVTVFGMSAGGASVDYHMLSDASQGLFHRTISMSGSSLCPWGFFSSSEAEAQAFRMGRMLGIFTDNKETLLTALYHVSAEDLGTVSEIMTFVTPPFSPVIEDKIIAGSEAFLTKCIIDKYKSGNFSQLPHLTGFMADESLMYIETSDMQEQHVDFSSTVLKKLELIAGVQFNSTFPILTSRAKIPVHVDSQDLNDFIEEDSDVCFISGVDFKHQLLVNYSSAPVYYYKNSFVSNVSLHQLRLGINKIGAAHADDEAYIFHMPGLPTDPADPFVITRDRIVRMWSNFAKYSDPTPLGTCDPLLNISWPESGPAGTHLQIDTELSVGRFSPVRSRVKIYEKILDAAASQIYQCSSGSTLGVNFLLTLLLYFFVVNELIL